MSDVADSPASGQETPGKPYTLVAGAYTVSENTFSGYTQSFSGNCDTSGHITLLAGDDKTCTITNDDILSTTTTTVTTTTIITITTTTTTTSGGGGGGNGGTPPATLHVVKIVINDNGGKSVVSDAVIHVTNGSINVPGSPHAGAGSPGTSYTLTPGIYNVSENFFPGYTMKMSGDCAVNGDVTLKSNDDKTCTITNNDIAGVTITTTTTTITTTVTPKRPPSIIVPAHCDICSRLTYDVYIVNPDGSERHTGTAWVRVTDRGNGIKRYAFEDATIDPRNPLYDYNDSVIDVDFKDCKNVKFMFISSDASWKHKIRIKVSIDGVAQSDTLVADDSKAVVGTIKTINTVAIINTKLACSVAPAVSQGLNGKILLQVQQHGEAWYVRPESGLRYYMKDGATAYDMMRKFGLGITDNNLAAIQSVATVDELKQSISACIPNSSATKAKGKILLQVQQHGEAWYVDANKCRRIYMKDGATAYTLMRFLGLGIADANLAKLKIGQ